MVQRKNELAEIEEKRQHNLRRIELEHLEKVAKEIEDKKTKKTTIFESIGNLTKDLPKEVKLMIGSSSSSKSNRSHEL